MADVHASWAAAVAGLAVLKDDAAVRAAPFAIRTGHEVAVARHRHLQLDESQKSISGVQQSSGDVVVLVVGHR